MVSAMNEKEKLKLFYNVVYQMMNYQIVLMFPKNLKQIYIRYRIQSEDFAYLAYNNMDSFGMRLPSIYENKDIVIIYNKKLKVL